MVGELVVRFLLGGVVVSIFALIGDLLKPKPFAGIFGGAPSVALAMLALTFTRHDAGYVALEGGSMLAGAVALVVYALEPVRNPPRG